MSGIFPLISIYLVNHNYGEYVRQAIESVLAQTQQDFELIIIDDGSTDDSRDVIEPYARHEKVMTIFQQNQGLNITNNIALREASGKYIMRLDADDYLDKHALEVMSATLERDEAIGLVFPDYFHVDVEGQVLEMVRRHDFDEVTVMDQPAHGACTMIRRELLELLEGYDESFRCQDGWDLWVRFVRHHKVQNINLPLFFYRQHGKNLTSNEERLLSTRADILRKAANNLSQPLKCIAIIPTRGITTDPNSLALRDLHGKPLLDWTIEAALSAECISDVVVTSPNNNILEHVRNTFGDRVTALSRDWKSALPNTTLDETLTDVFAQLPNEHRNFDAVAILFVESPFRSSKYIDMAADVMQLFSTDRVIGVRPETSTFYQHNGAGLTRLQKDTRLKFEKEDLFRQVGNITLVRRGCFLQEMMNDNERVGHVVLSQTAALSIKSQWDWDVAEIIAATFSLQ
jgi:CMP-N-acetylneuraminic acid synthetase